MIWCAVIFLAACGLLGPPVVEGICLVLLALIAGGLGMHMDEY